MNGSRVVSDVAGSPGVQQPHGAAVTHTHHDRHDDMAGKAGDQGTQVDA